MAELAGAKEWSPATLGGIGSLTRFLLATVGSVSEFVRTAKALKQVFRR